MSRDYVANDLLDNLDRQPIPWRQRPLRLMTSISSTVLCAIVFFISIPFNENFFRRYNSSINSWKEYGSSLFLVFVWNKLSFAAFWKSKSLFTKITKKMHQLKDFCSSLHWSGELRSLRKTAAVRWTTLLRCWSTIINSERPWLNV